MAQAKKPLIRILIVLILFGGLWLVFRNIQFSREVVVFTNKTEYLKGEDPRITIKNNLGEKVCFSSCYPYRLEKAVNEAFRLYEYADCTEEDLVEICMYDKEVKSFRILLDNLGIDGGIYHIVIPACVGCSFQENFRYDDYFYSNTFSIK